MILSWTEDPLRDVDRYDEECERWLQKRPVCCKCHEHIQEEYKYEMDGDVFCEDCFKEYMLDMCRVRIEENEWEN